MKKLRIASVILLVVGIIPLIASLLMPYIASIKGYSPSIGIIGGVDADITKTLFW